MEKLQKKYYDTYLNKEGIMIRILVINPLNVNVYNNYVEEKVTKIISPNTHVDVTNLELPKQPPSLIVSNQPFYMGELFKVLWNGQCDGYNALVIYCAADPGLYEARRMLSIPVIGPLEAGLHLASIITDRFSIIIPRPSTVSGFADLVCDKARHYGLAHHLVSVLSDNVTPPSDQELEEIFMKDPDKAKKAVLDAYIGALDRDIPKLVQKAIMDGAQAVLFACTFWTGMLKDLQKRFEIPLIDLGTAAVLMAESVARLRSATH
jgi:allantoin racemase